MQAETHEITESKSKDIQIILSYFNVLSSLDFLVFWLMISITASDTKTRPPIFQQVLGKSLEQGMAMAAPQCGGGENNVSTINHFFSCIAPGSRDNLRHSLILPGHAWKTLALKSVNLQYNMLVRWADGINDSLTKHLTFQVFFFHNYL